MKTGIVIQARMKSTRLPGKIMLLIMGRPMLEYLLERVKKIERADQIIVATTFDQECNVICNICKNFGVAFIRGSERDVLARYIKAIERFQLDTVVRLTSDNPLIDPDIVDRMILFYRKNPSFDYLNNFSEGDGYPLGYSIEVMKAAALKRAFAEAEHLYEHEHVTPYLIENQEKFSLATFRPAKSYPRLRLTVDTEEDFKLVKWIFKMLYKHNKLFTLDDVIRLLESYPEMTKINKSVRQKGIRETEI